MLLDCWCTEALGLGGERRGSLLLLSLSVLPKLVSRHVNGELTHPVVVFVAYWDHTPSSELTTHMGTRALGIPMPVICTINAVPWVSVLAGRCVVPIGHKYYNRMCEFAIDMTTHKFW